MATISAAIIFSGGIGFGGGGAAYGPVLGESRADSNAVSEYGTYGFARIHIIHGKDFLMRCQ